MLIDLGPRTSEHVSPLEGRPPSPVILWREARAAAGVTGGVEQGQRACREASTSDSTDASSGGSGEVNECALREVAHIEACLRSESVGTESNVWAEGKENVFYSNQPSTEHVIYITKDRALNVAHYCHIKLGGRRELCLKILIWQYNVISAALVSAVCRNLFIPRLDTFL